MMPLDERSVPLITSTPPSPSQESLGVSEKSAPRRPFNAYLEPEQARWLDSMEGVPEPPAGPARDVAWQQEPPWKHACHQMLDWLGEMAPGLALAGVLAWVGSTLATQLGTTVLGFDRSPISAILVTVLLGLLVRHLAGLPAVYEKGLRLAVKRILRVGIVLLGLRLSLVSVGQIGLMALPIVAGCIAVALFLAGLLGRLVGLPSRLSTLISVGTGICGVSAIVATAPAIGAEEEEVSYAVACITLFGLAALFVYPFAAHGWFGGHPQLIGLFLGTAIHDTSQVAGAALLYRDLHQAPAVLSVAVTTKLVRNLSMGLVIPLMAVLYHRGRTDRTDAMPAGRPGFEAAPLFVFGFVAMAALRSAGDLGTRAFAAVDPVLWQQGLVAANRLAVICLTMAMAAVGLGTSIAQLKVLGWKPLFVGLGAALSVGAVSFTLIRLLEGFSS